MTQKAHSQNVVISYFVDLNSATQSTSKDFCKWHLYITWNFLLCTSSSLSHRWDDDMYVGDWSSTPSEHVCLCRLQVHNWERYPDRHYFRPCPLTTCQMTTDRTRNQQSGFVRIESVAKCFCPLTTHHSMPRECPQYSSVSNRILSCIHGKHCNGDSIHWLLLSYWDLFLDIPFILCLPNRRIIMAGGGWLWCWPSAIYGCQLAINCRDLIDIVKLVQAVLHHCARICYASASLGSLCAFPVCSLATCRPTKQSSSHWIL